MSRRCGSNFWLIAAAVWLSAAVTVRLAWQWNPELPAALAALSLFVAVDEWRRWRKPAASLHEMIKAVRDGKTSLEEMSQRWGDAPGEIGRLASDYQDVLRGLREGKLAIAVLEKEMSDRVANRTSALERQLSTTRIQASRDALTGLFNRRMLVQTFLELFDKCRTQREELTVLAIDVDRFKPLNDTLGHAAGDEFLRSIGQILRSGVRACDLPIRIGGDEFLILLPGCGLGPARALGGRLATMVDGVARTLGMSNPPSLSVGAATLTQLPTSATSQQLLEAADKDLYAVKAMRKRAA